MIELRMGRARIVRPAHRTGAYHPRVRYTVRPRIRIVRDDDDATIILGPGKADLLEAIARTGSIRSAARSLDMSYMRAWNLVRTMNAAFRSPLVEKERGGAEQGGTHLTERGTRILTLYRAMESQAEKAIAATWRKLREELGS
jgi:molybdate transport system regulatory protein